MQAENVRDLLDRWRPALGVVGAQVGLLSAEQRLVVCSGTLEPSGAPVVPDTAFHAGSLAKPLAATVVLAAARRGELDLDTPVDEQAAGLWDDTPRQLMAQTTGRPNLLPEHDEPIEAFVTRAGALPRVHPRGRFSYCNAGWAVLDLLLRRRTGRSFEQHARDEVALGDFGMPLGAAAGHEVSAGGDVRPVPPMYADAASAAGSRWWATADQLLDLASAQLGRLPSRAHPDDLQAMRTAHAQVPGATVSDAWGLGWALWQREDHVGFGWAGYTGGHRAHLRCFPEQQAAVVVLSNTAGPLLGPPGGSALFDVLLPHLLDEVGVPRVPALPAVPGASSPAAELAGTYGPFRLDAAGEAMTLHAGAMGEPEPLALDRVHGDTFERRGNPPGAMRFAVEGGLLYLGPFAVPRG